MEGKFSQHIYYPREQIYIFHGWTSWSNMAYQVWRPVVKRPYQWEWDPMVIAFMQACIQRARHAAGGKVVIYANTVWQAQAMVEVFRCKAYHSWQVDWTGVLERFI
jgi:hypothetical protein